MNDERSTGSLFSCGCCEGIEPLTPIRTANRPGLDALAYRVGTHATFLETMKARLSGFVLENEPTILDDRGKLRSDAVSPLRGLTTRESDDPTIALLDAWATVADVLTFYQERIANEGYMKTATERRSVLELARLINYSLRPGVAASVFFALTLEQGHNIVLKRNELKAQSIPGPGELPQTFENSEELEARAVWNTLKPRTARPQTETSITTSKNKRGEVEPRIYLKGIATNLKANDPLLLEFKLNDPELYRVTAVEADPVADKTLVEIKPWGEVGFTIEEGTGTIGSLRDRIENLITTTEPHSSLATVGRARTLLEGLRDELDRGTTDVALAKHINADVLPELSRTSARLGSRSTTAAPLLDKLTSELENVVVQITDVDPMKVVIKDLTKTPSVQPRNSLYLSRNLETHFGNKSDAGLQLISAFEPTLRDVIPTTFERASSRRSKVTRAYALRTKASLFGHNALLKSEIESIRGNNENPKAVVNFVDWDESDIALSEDRTTLNGNKVGNVVYLDASYDKVQPGGWVVVDSTAVDEARTRMVKLRSGGRPLIARTGAPKSKISRTAYGLNGATTRIDLLQPSSAKELMPWILFEHKDPLPGIEIIRKTVVYTESEELALAEEPMDEAICANAGSTEIELDGLYSDLKSGRWLILSGERTDVRGLSDDDTGDNTGGVKVSEVVMLAGVNHRVVQDLPGDRLHTFIELAEKPSYCYKRSTATIYANVVKANHGETRNEVLGSGDGTKAFQSFTLRQPPLTYVASPTPSGADSTLNVYVNEVKWEQAAILAELGPRDRKFIARTDDEGKTTVVFGDGKHGARLPTGAENVRAIYRNGIGKSANVRKGQISLLMSRPLGVKEVINPIRATGGADKEPRDQARKNAPLTVRALDRLISTQDYADFARTFAGIGKSSAARLSDGRRELVHVTIAGADNIPIDETSDLFRNLTDALLRFGDPFQPLKVELRELKFLFVSARLGIGPEYLWDKVVTNVRSKLLDRFSFERRELGQDVMLSEVISTIQSVAGVSFVDVDVFGAVPEKKSDGNQRRLLTPAELLAEVRDLSGPAERVNVDLAYVEKGLIRPAQLAYFTPDVPETLILNQI